MKNQKQSVLLSILLAASVVAVVTAASAGLLKASLLAQEEPKPVVAPVDTSYEEMGWQENIERWVKDESRHLKDRKRECKDMARDIRRAKRKLKEEVGAIEEGVVRLCSAVDRAQELVRAVRVEEGQDAAEEKRDIAQEYMQENIHDVTGDLWDQIGLLNNKMNVVQAIRQERRTCKNWSREVKNILREGRRSKIDAAALEAFRVEGEGRVATCEQSYAALQELGQQGKWEEAQDLLQETFYDSEMWDWLQEQRATLLACAETSNIVRRGERLLKQMKRTEASFARRSKDVTSLQSIIAAAESLLASSKQAIAQNTCDPEFSQEDHEELETLRRDFEDVQNVVRYGKRSAAPDEMFDGYVPEQEELGDYVPEQ